MSLEFDFLKMNKKYSDGLLKDHLDCKNYISQFFIPLKNGSHALIENNLVNIIQKETMKEVYLQRFEKDIQNWYKTKTIPKELICDITKPIVGNNFVNIGKQLKHKYIEYNSFQPEVKTKVNLMLSYIKEVWASNDEKVFQYMLKWLSNMVRGNKNKSCLYAKSLQGTGKSTLPEFIRDYVIGSDITCKGKADHLKGQHNLQLLGRIFVYFEELQIFSDKEWYAVDSELKDMITDDRGSYTDKYEKRFEAQNINNYMIITNSNLKGVNGRRYLVCDLSSKYMDDFVYYGNLRNNCFNDEVGKAFFCYLMEINIDNFNSLDLPETKSKLSIIADLLSPIEKFLKFNYVLRNTPIKAKLKDLHENFQLFDNGKSLGVSIHKFNSDMRDLGLLSKRMTVGHVFDISLEELNNLANKRKWLNELDDDIIDKNGLFDDSSKLFDDAPAIDYKTLYENLKKENDDLLNKFKLLESQIQNQTTVKDTIDKLSKKVEKLVKHSDYNFGRNKSLPKNDIDDEMNIIIEECDLFQPQKKTKDECDFIEIKKGVYQNKKTNKEYTIAKSLKFDGKLF